MIGAILRDSGVAGPRDEKVAMFARLSDSAKGCKVISSERVAPTVTMFLAVEGGGIWIGLGMKVEGQGTGQSSVFVPLKKSGMTRGLQNSGRVASISAPLLPAGPNTRKSRLLYRKVSMSADCWGKVPAFRWNWTVEKLSGAPNGVTARCTSAPPPVIPAQAPVPPVLGQISSAKRVARLPGSTLPPRSTNELKVQRPLSAMSDTMMRAPRATPSRLALRAEDVSASFLWILVKNAPTWLGLAAMTLATMFPWLPPPLKIESQSLPLSRTGMIEWTLRCAGPNGCVRSVTCVAV